MILQDKMIEPLFYFSEMRRVAPGLFSSFGRLLKIHLGSPEVRMSFLLCQKIISPPKTAKPKSNFTRNSSLPIKVLNIFKCTPGGTVNSAFQGIALKVGFLVSLNKKDTRYFIGLCKIYLVAKKLQAKFGDWAKGILLLKLCKSILKIDETGRVNGKWMNGFRRLLKGDRLTKNLQAQFELWLNHILCLKGEGVILKIVFLWRVTSKKFSDFLRFVGTFSYFCRMLKRYNKIKGLRLSDLVFTQVLFSRRFESRRNPCFFPQSEYVSVSFPLFFSSLLLEFLNPVNELLLSNWSVITGEGKSLPEGLG